MADTGDKVIRVYSDFRGIDLRGEECAINRSPDALNVWRDYRELSGIKTRPALKKLSGHNNGVKLKDIRWHNTNGENRLYVLDANGNMCYHAETDKDGILDGMNLSVGINAFFFEFGGKLYAMGTDAYVNVTDGITYKYGLKDEQETDTLKEPFIPTTSVGASPSGSGRKTHQDVNMLTPYRKNSFRADGESKVFYVDAERIDHDYIPMVYLDGEYVFQGKTLQETHSGGGYTGYYYTKVAEGENIASSPDRLIVNYELGYVEVFKNGEVLPEAKGGTDNVVIKFKKAVKDKQGNDVDKDKILGCTMAQEFDNRVFFSGNSKYPNLVFHSSLNDVTYFSDLDVYEDGKDDGKIRAMVAGNNALWVFRDTDKGNGVYYHTAAFDETYGKVYPSAHSSVSIGCVGGAVNFLDDILFFSREGVEGITQNVTAEQFATHKSSLVDREMLKNKDYKDLVLAEWEGYLIVFIGSEAYLADSRAVLANEGHYEYEWYRWQLFKDNRDSVTCATVHKGDLYIGTKEGYIFKLDKDTKNGDEYYYEDKNYATIESYWTTPRDKFASSNKQKTTSKKGCIVECTGDLAVSSKVDGDNRFDDGDAYSNVTDHIVPKIKRKKFKDIQLKFSSNTKFTLESATLEAFVGSYIKK